MGVKSLISYLDRTGFKLDFSFFTPALCKEGVCPRRLIVDGSSFIHHVFFAHSDWTFSGDYTVLKAYIKAYIILLNLTIGWDGQYRDHDVDFPIVGKIPLKTSDESWLLWVLDGPLPDSKVYTRCCRIKQKLEASRMMFPKVHQLRWGQSQPDAQGKFIAILTHSLFLETLKEMKQTIVMADDEADQPSAFYAKRFDAAVLSNDSDFIVYDIPRGFLYMPSFSASKSTLELLSNYGCYLEAKDSVGSTKPQFEISFYCFAKVFEHLKINPVHFPLLASLMGNDYTGEISKQISKLAAIKLQEFPYRRGLISQNHINNHRLIGYFGTLKDKNSGQALKEIQEKLALSSATIDVIYSSTLSYQTEHLSSQETLRNTHIDEQMAKKLLALYKKGILGFQAMDIVMHSRFWGLPLIENVGPARSSWVVSAPLRTLFWALIGSPDSKEAFQDIIPISSSQLKAVTLSRAEIELCSDKAAAFQALLHVVHRSPWESLVNSRGRFWLLLAFLHTNPPKMPPLELADYVPLYSSSIHHVAFILLLRYLGEQLSPTEISSDVLKGFVATYAFLYHKGYENPLGVYSGISVTVQGSVMRYSNQLQTLILSFQMLWGLVVNSGHETGPPFELMKRIDSHIFFHFCDLFSNRRLPDDMLGQDGCVLFNLILPFVYR